MRIAILGLNARAYGTFTYLKNLLPHLAEIDTANTYLLFLPRDKQADLAPDAKNFHVRSSPFAERSGLCRILWELFVLPAIVWLYQIDLVYTANNLAVLLSSVPSVIAVQNVEPFFAGEFPNAPRLRLRLWLLRALSKLSLRKSARIVAVSDWVKDFLLERYHLPAEKVVVTVHGTSDAFRPPAADTSHLLRDSLGIEKPYLLCVTRLAGYGNLLNLAKAVAMLDTQNQLSMPLVVPGGVWDERYVRSVMDFLARQGSAGRVKFLGLVPHHLMPLLYANAELFVFPSLLESCGNALIEGLACGAPTLCSDRRPMRDIAGDSALYFDGESPEDIAEKMLKVLADSALRTELARRGPLRAAQFSWRDGAEKLCRIFAELNPTAGAAVPKGKPLQHDKEA